VLVLARREGDELVIAEVIRVKVLSITGSIVRLGFEAPEGVRIERLENTDNKGAIPSERSSKA
jgi:carbon storage regulator CsrA